jgi:hypothetical protein
MRSCFRRRAFCSMSEWIVRECITIAWYLLSGIAVLTLARPEAKNALGRVFLQQLKDNVEALRFDPTVRVVILRSGVDKACILPRAMATMCHAMGFGAAGDATTRSRGLDPHPAGVLCRGGSEGARENEPAGGRRVRPQAARHVQRCGGRREGGRKGARVFVFFPLLNCPCCRRVLVVGGAAAAHCLQQSVSDAPPPSPSRCRCPPSRASTARPWEAAWSSRCRATCAWPVCDVPRINGRWNCPGTVAALAMAVVAAGLES